MKIITKFTQFINENVDKYSEESMKLLSDDELELLTRNIQHYGATIHNRAKAELERRKNENINESIDINGKYVIDNLYRKYDTQQDTTAKGLEESMNMIGDGEVEYTGTKPSSISPNISKDRFKYVEYFKDNTLILVVHGFYGRRGHGDRGYYYEIGVYKNDPRTQQIGGGYGASGIMSKEYTKLFGYINDNTTYDINTISKVCGDVRDYFLNK